MTDIETEDRSTFSFAAQKAAADARREADLAEFIRTADRLQITSIDIPIHTADQLCTVLGTIGSHNSYDHQEAVTTLAPVLPGCERVSVEHCADGPIITFVLPFWTGHSLAYRHAAAVGPANRKLEANDRVLLAEDIIRRGKALLADSIRVQQSMISTNPPTLTPQTTEGTPGSDPSTITLWWD